MREHAKEKNLINNLKQIIDLFINFLNINFIVNACNKFLFRIYKNIKTL